MYGYISYEEEGCIVCESDNGVVGLGDTLEKSLNDLSYKLSIYRPATKKRKPYKDAFVDAQYNKNDKTRHYNF